jgi:hypothetical protein
MINKKNNSCFFWKLKLIKKIINYFNNKKKTALLFEIELDGMDTSFEISVTSKEWVTALENCLKHFEEWEMGDDAIDTYLLIKQLKQK